jgi:hypothetical protein
MPTNKKILPFTTRIQLAYCIEWKMKYENIRESIPALRSTPLPNLKAHGLYSIFKFS